jgi:predicted MFS family arabinose efflux permease
LLIRDLSHLGGVIFPVIFLNLQPITGFPWAIRVIAFVQLFCVLVALPILWQLSLPPAGKARQLIHWHAFKQPAFSSHFVSGFLVFMAYLVPLVYISPYSVQVLKQTSSTAYYQLAVSNATSAFGRIGSAWLSLKVGGPNVLVFSLLSSSLLIFAWIGVESSAGFWVWCTVWGFCSGIIVSVNPVVVAHPTISHSPAVLGTRLGMQWFSTSFGFLIGVPIAGILLQDTADIRIGYERLQIFGGAIMLGGAAFFSVPYWAIHKHNRRSPSQS